MAGGYIGILSVELHFPDTGSLKGKRKHVLSAKSQLQSRFGASVAEVDHHDLWQRSRLTLALVSRTAGESDARLAEVSRWLHSDEAFQVVGEASEIITVEGDD